MFRYRVTFWYYTDLRCDWEGEAANELAAIGIAQTHHKLTDWCNNALGFKLSVERL